MQFVTYSVVGRIGSITLNRPEKRNAFNSQLVTELQEAFQTAEDDALCKVIVLKASGSVFSAGADLGYLQQLQNNSYEENYADSTALKQLFQKIYLHKKVVIAQVEGHAIAGGCGLAAVCDFVYSVPQANFGYSEVKIGFVPAIVMFYLLRKTNEKTAKELLLTGKIITATQAKDLGLINEVVDSENIDKEVTQLAMHLIENCSAQSLSLTKRMIGEIQDLAADQALDYAAKNNASARESADCKKGIAGFLKRETITW